jgi:DNA-binding transcriptional LysR family regulator
METISILSLEAAEALARSGSLAGAARELHRTPAAVHKQLKQLENALGAPLYEKVGRGIRLSGAMKTFLPHAIGALTQVAAARRAVEEWRGLHTGIVRIGTGPTLSTHWLPQIVAAFRRMHAGVQVTIDTGTTDELLEQLRRGQLDLAMILEDSRARRDDRIVLGQWNAAAVLATGCRNLRRATSLKELQKEAFLAFRTGTRMAAHVDRYFAQHHHEPNTAMRCDNADAIRAMLGTGFGYAILPQWTFSAQDGVKLWAIPAREKVPPMRVEIVCASGFPLAPGTKAFAEVAKKFPLP